MVKTLPEVTIAELKERGLSPLPREIRVFEMQDPQGDDALRAVLVFPNHLTEDELAWKKVREVHDTVRDLLRERDEKERFVYVKIRRTRELRDEDEA